MSLRNFGNQIKTTRCLWRFFTVMLQTIADDDDLRFGFGRNWADFVASRLNDSVVEASRLHMADMLRAESLEGKTILDIGSGSGIHSLAALRLGAERIISFDYDRDSVATTRKVREHAGSPANWEVMQGSVLDAAFMASLPTADIVYSWGVLHHTGAMWSAVRNAASLLKPDGVFYIALYSSDNYVDPPPSYWMKVKKRYNMSGSVGRRLLEWRYALRFHILPELKAGRNPVALIRDYGSRGMTYWTDVRDWLGGWPMDFASLAETRDFSAREFGLALVNLKTGEGCTEYVFARPELNAHWCMIEASRVSMPLEGPFHAAGGHHYSASLPPHLESVANTNELPRRSTVMLYENGVPLGLGHSIHDHITRFGCGRFSHWGGNLHFSTSDNSDPNTNGRIYTYCERY